MERPETLLLRKTTGRLIERVTTCLSPHQKALYDRVMELNGDAPEYLRLYIESEFPRVIAELERIAQPMAANG